MSPETRRLFQAVLLGLVVSGLLWAAIAWPLS